MAVRDSREIIFDDGPLTIENIGRTTYFIRQYAQRSFVHSSKNVIQSDLNQLILYGTFMDDADYVTDL